MRKMYSCFGLCSISLLAATASLDSQASNGKIVIVGKNQALHFNAPHNGDYYVQTGTFGVPDNALNARSQLERKLQYPVSIEKRGRYQVVLVGPVKTAAEVRAVGETAFGGSAVHAYRRAAAPQYSHASAPYRPQAASMRMAQHSHVSNDVYMSKMGAVEVAPRFGGYKPWVSVEGGYVFSIAPTNVNTEPMPGVNLPDDYNSILLGNHWLAGAAAGVQFSLPSTVFPSDRLGLAYNYYSNADLTGQIVKYQSVPTYSYNYTIQSTNVLWLDNQLDLRHVGQLMPFIDVAIGAAWKTTNNYQEEPLPNVPPQNVRVQGAAFSSNASTAFAWRVGLGGNLNLTDKLKLGLAYRYANLGKATTGPSDAYPTVGSISNSVAGNEAVLSLRYDFDTTGDMK